MEAGRNTSRLKAASYSKIENKKLDWQKE